jgi:hypothetical protein
MSHHPPPKPAKRKNKAPLPTSCCPSCGKTLNAATHINFTTPEPKPGDLSVCFYCGDLACYNDILVLEPASPEMLVLVPPELIAKITALRFLTRRTHPAR